MSWMNTIKRAGAITLLSAVLTCKCIFAAEPKDIFRNASPAIVYVVSRADPNNTSLGSGFVIDPEGIILTNQHVVANSQAISVRFRDGAMYPVTGTMYNDATRDICLLKIDAHKLPYLTLADSNSVSVGDKVYTIGNPMGVEFTFSDGMISGIRNLQNIKYLQFSAPVSPGNSGGPLLNSDGQVIGVVTASALSGNLNFAVAINEAKSLIAAAPKPSSAPPVLNKSDEFFIKGNVFALLQENDQAIACYNKAIEENPNLAEAYSNRGLIYNNKGNNEQAMSDLNKAITLNPNLSDAYNNRGLANMSVNDLARADLDFKKAIELNPKHALAYNNLGLVSARKGDRDLAISDFSKAIEIDPNFGLAYSNRAAVYYQKKDYDKAWADVYKAAGLKCSINAKFLNDLKKASGRDK